MASNQRPAHGSSAQVIEFECTLSTGHDDEPDRATIELSTDANNTFSIRVDPRGDHPEWRFDARIVKGSIEIVEAFRDGLQSDDRPHWLDTVTTEARTRLVEGSQ